MNEKLTRLYINAKKHFDLPSFDQFKVDMQDPVKMSALRENMLKHYEMPSLDQMYQDFGVKKKDLPGVSTFQKEGMDSDIKEDPTTILSEYSGETLDLDKFLDKTEEEAITILQQELAGKNYLVEETGIGDALKVIDNDTGEETTIDLQPIKAFGIGSDKETEIKKINKLISKPTNLDFTEDSEAFKKIEEDIAKIKEEIDISIDTSEDEFLSDQDYFKNLFDTLEKEGVIVPQQAKDELSSGKKITGYTTDFRGKLPVYGNLNKQDVLNGIQKYFGDYPQALEKIKQFNLGGATFFRQSQIDKATKLKIENYYESRPDRDKIKDIVFQVDKSMNEREVDITTNLELAKKDLSKLLASVKSDLSKIKEKSPGFKINWNNETNSLDMSGENIPEEANVLYKKISDAIDGNMQLIKKSTSDLEIINSKRKTSSEFTDAAKRNYNIIDSAYSDLKNAVVQMGGGFAMFPSLITDAIKDAVLPEGVYVPSVGFMNISTQQLRKEMGDSQENLQNFFKTKRAYKEAVDEDSFGEFAIREFFTQAPNLTLAIGTAGVGSSIGLSGAATSTLIASQFGVTSAGQKYDELTKRQEFVKIAEQGLSELEKLKGSIPDEQYLSEKYELERAIKDGDISAGKKTLAVLGTGLVEGTITRFLGTAPNAIKVVKDLKNPTKFMDDILKSNRKAVFEAGKDWTGRILGEIAEETSIDALTQINDFAFLGDQIDLSSLDDTAVTSIITSGAMNTPSIAYSTILTQVNVNRYKNQVKAQTDQIQALKKMLNDSGLTDFQRDAIHNTINTSISNIADITTNMEADALLLGADNIKELITLSGVKKSMMDKAGVEVNDSYEVAGAKIDNYIKLLKSTDKKQAKEFTDNMSYIDNRRNDIIKKINYEGAVEKVFGKKGLDVAATLPKGLSAQQVYTQTYDQIRNEINDNAKKEYEDTVEQVEPEVTEQVSPEQEVETVQELLNRPVTLTELGGSKLETPIEGDMYLDGQQVVVEDADGNITEIGNVDEISDKTLEDMGIKQQMPEVTATEDGNIEYQGKQYNPASANISLDSRGNVTKVVISEVGKARSKTFRGKNADDVVYNKFLIDATNLTDIEQKLEKDEEFQNELRKVKTTPKVKADEDTQESVEQTGVERLKGLFDRKQVGTERRNSLDQKIKIDEQVEKAKKSLGKLFPDITIDAYYNENEYYRARGKRDNSRGVFNSATNTISINLTNADKATVPHEVFHAILFNTLKSDPKIQKVVKDMVKAMKNTQDPGLIKFLSDEIQRLGYEENVQNEEIMSELFGALAGDYKNLKPNTQNIIKKFLDKLAKLLGLKPFTDTEIIGVLNTLAGRVAKGEAITEQDVAVLTEGASTFIDGPTTISTKKNKLQLKAPNKPGVLSFVTKKDLIDIDALTKEISNKGQKVWFWVADQLGRGLYMDTQVGTEHYLDAGPSYALDPENRNKNIIWATGKSEGQVTPLVNDSDYIFIISGSPIKSKLFNKRVINILKDRVGDYNKFKEGVLNSKPIKPIKDVLEKHDSWESITESPDRKKLLNSIEEVKKKKDTPLKTYLEDNNSFIDINSLRDSFYSDNDFQMNDVMLVLKPTGFGGKSKHSTYENDILGEVVGVPNKKVNAYDLMPAEVKQKYSDAMSQAQKAQVVAPYGAGIRTIKEQKGKGITANEIARKGFENDISEADMRQFAQENNISLEEMNIAIDNYKKEIAIAGAKAENMFTDKGVVFNFFDKLRRKFLSSRGFMPKSMHIGKEALNGMIEAESKQALNTLKDLQKFIKKYKGDEDAFIIELDNYLRGYSDIDVLPEGVQEIAYAMRTHIDHLSRQLVKSGAVSDTQFDELGKKSKDKLIKEYGSEENARAHFKTSKENILQNIGLYMTRSYEIFDNPDYSPSDEIIVAAKNKLREQYQEVAEELAAKNNNTVEAELQKLVDDKIEDILTVSGANDYLQGSKLGSKKTGILKQRMNIPSEIRALMGEYTDPALNYARSIQKISALVANQKFLNQMKKAGEGVFFFKERTNEFNTQIASEGSDTMNPLNGMFTTPEIAEAMTNSPLVSISSPLSPLYNLWLTSVGGVKFSKTILSPATHAKNIIGNLFFMAYNGYTNPKDYFNSLKVVYNDLAGLSNKELRSKLDEYIRAGIINQSATLGEIKSLFRQKDNIEDILIKRMNDPKLSLVSKFKKHIKKSADFAQNLYQAEDDFFKIVSYENEKRRYAKAFFNKDFNSLNNTEKKEVLDYITEITKNILPNYSRIGELGKFMKAFPVAGTFISFQIESMRTAYNTIDIAFNELKDPKTRSIGLKRLTGIMSIIGVKAAILGTFGMTEDEEEEASRIFLPPWAKNANIYISEMEDGKFKYINFSASDPHGFLDKALIGYLKGEDTFESMTSVLDEIVGPFYQKDILFNALTNITANENDYGREIFNETDTPNEVTEKILSRLWKVFEPGAVTSARKVLGSDTPLNEIKGQLTGFKEWEVDLKDQVLYKSIDIKARSSEAGKDYRKALTEFKKRKINREELEERYQKANQRYKQVIEEGIELYNSALKLGLSKKYVILEMKGKFSQYEIANIVRGKVPEKRR
jgi:hypothetical protein